MIREGWAQCPPTSGYVLLGLRPNGASGLSDLHVDKKQRGQQRHDGDDLAQIINLSRVMGVAAFLVY